MDTVIKILQFIVSLSLLVIIHEFGHFLFARLFKTRVEKFYLFFDPWFSLFKFKKGDTEYGIGWVPFGGYVKISGMIDESMDTEQMKSPPQPYEFRAKPAWQRLLIMVGGVVMNVVFALIIYIGMSYKWGETVLENKDIVYGYTFNSLGQEMGFRNGDRIVDIDGKPATEYLDVLKSILISQPEYVTVDRKKKKIRIDITDESINRLLQSADSTSLLMPRIPFVVGSVVSGSGAAQAGLHPGDSLISYNGTPMTFFDQYSSAFHAAPGDTITLGLVRKTDGMTKITTLPVKVSAEGTIGVYPRTIDSMLTFSTHNYSLLESIPAGFKRTGAEISSYIDQIKLLFNPKTEAYKSLGGVITMGSIFPTEWDWQRFWSITAFLSIILAVMNILPIPALDGGHVLFLLVEVITRRKPSDKFLEYAQIVGMFIIFALMIFATGNDIYRFFIK